MNKGSAAMDNEDIHRFFNITLDLLCIADTGGYFRLLNQAWETTLGYPLSQLEGSQLLDYVHPEDVNRTLAAMAELTAQKPVINFVNRYRCKDGTYRWIEWRTAPAGNLIYAAARDITERKQVEDALRANEERLHLATRAGNIGVWDWDVVKDELTWDDSMFSLYGIRREDFDGAYAAWAGTIHPEDREFIDGEIQAALRGEQEYAPEFRVVRPDGSIRMIRAASHTYRDPNGSALRMVGTNIDITERQITEKQLLLNNEKLIEMVSTLEQLNRQAHLLHEMDDLLQSCKVSEEAFMALQKFGPLLFPSTAGALYLIGDAPETVEAVAAWGENLQSESVFSPEDCWALRRGKVHHWSSLSPSLHCRHVPASFSGDYLDIPMLAASELLGILHIESLDFRLSDKGMLELAQTITEHLALTHTNIKLREKLHAQSIRDPLTGLFNRRFMEEYLVRELSRAARKQSTIGVIMMDIDHFKDFNDTYGHHGGDAALRELGALLEAKIRGGDIACRFGGEEFILILPETSLAVTRQRAEEIREEVRGMKIEFLRKVLGRISVSMGVAVFPDHGDNSDILLSIADKALYAAKHHGRDRVEVAGQ